MMNPVIKITSEFKWTDQYVETAQRAQSEIIRPGSLLLYGKSEVLKLSSKATAKP